MYREYGSDWVVSKVVGGDSGMVGSREVCEEGCKESSGAIEGLKMECWGEDEDGEMLLVKEIWLRFRAISCHVLDFSSGDRDSE